MRILLVEDEKTLSGYIAKGLQNSGYAVDAVYDGEEALYEYAVNGYDLIVLDLNLPKKDGLDVLREIRRKDVNIKILILSARSAVDDRIIGLDEGANDYLVKHFHRFQRPLLWDCSPWTPSQNRYPMMVRRLISPERNMGFWNI